MPEAEGEAVQLFVYDLSGGMARAFSQMLLGRTIEAIYHTSIVVAGAEYYFGGGINVARAGHTPFGRPIQVLDLGRTQLPEDVREALLADLSERYTPESYSLLSNNCNNFSDELAQLLCGSGIPQHITGLPAEVLSTPFGQMVAPMLSGLEEQMRSMRAQAHIEPAAAAGLAGAPAATTSGAAAGAAPAVEAAAPAAGAAAAEPAAEPAVPADGAAGGAAGAAGAAEEQEGSGLRSAEVEIEAAVAAGMIQEAEQALGSLELQAAAGQQPAAAAAAAAAAVAPAEEPAAPAAPAVAPAPPAAATRDKLATERAVEAEFKRLVAAGMAEHEAQALALEAVAAAAGAVTDNPVQHGLGTGGGA